MRRLKIAVFTCHCVAKMRRVSAIAICTEPPAPFSTLNENQQSRQTIAIEQA